MKGTRNVFFAIALGFAAAAVHANPPGPAEVGLLAIGAPAPRCPYGKGVIGHELGDHLSSRDFYIVVWACAQGPEIPGSGRHYLDQVGRNPMRQGGYRSTWGDEHNPRMISFTTAGPHVCRVMDKDWRVHTNVTIPANTVFWGDESRCEWRTYYRQGKLLGWQYFCPGNSDAIDQCANAADCGEDLLATTLLRGLDGRDGLPGYGFDCKGNLVPPGSAPATCPGEKGDTVVGPAGGLGWKAKVGIGVGVVGGTCGVAALMCHYHVLICQEQEEVPEQDACPDGDCHIVSQGGKATMLSARGFTFSRPTPFTPRSFVLTDTHDVIKLGHAASIFAGATAFDGGQVRGGLRLVH